MTRVCGKLRPLLDGCRGNRDCWDSVAKGEAIQESAMRLPTDAEGADTNYRDRLIALLHVPPLPSGLISPDVSRMSPSPQMQDSSRRSNYSNSSINTTGGSGDEAPPAGITVGGSRGGGAAPT